MELINQSANAVLPHSCNFKEGSQKKKANLHKKSSDALALPLAVRYKVQWPECKPRNTSVPIL